MASPTPLHLVLDNTMGAQLIGVLLAAGLYGISCTQTWYYYTLYSTDRIGLRFLVAFVWLFDTCHQALISHTVYIYLVKNFDNPAELGNLVWSLLVEVLFNGMTALLVQGFFTFRIWRLSGRNIPLTALVASLIIAEFTVVVVYTVQSLHLQTFVQLAELKHLSMVVNVLAAAGDVLIALILCTMLHRSKTGFRGSDSMINHLMTYAVNTGLLTSICAVMSLVSICVWPNAFIYICFYFMLGRLYSNSLLATLNARRSIRGMHTDSDGFSMTIPSFAQESPSKRKHTLSVRVDTVHERMADPTYSPSQDRRASTRRFADTVAAKAKHGGARSMPPIRMYASETDVDVEIEIDDMDDKHRRHSTESSPTLATPGDGEDIGTQHFRASYFTRANAV